MLTQEEMLELKAVVRRAVEEEREMYDEVWLTEKELIAQFGMFTHDWLKKYGHCLQPVRAIVVDENVMLAAENQELKHDKNYLDLIMRSKALLTISQIAQDYGMSGKALNKKLADMGIQYSINGQWILYAKYKDCGYVSSRSIDITRADGRPDVVLHTEWTQAGRKFLYEELKKQGIIPMLERD